MFTASCSFLENAARSWFVHHVPTMQKLQPNSNDGIHLHSYIYHQIVCVCVSTQVCTLFWYKEPVLVLLMVIKSFKHTLTEH